jgi:hypothetical protein
MAPMEFSRGLQENYSRKNVIIKSHDTLPLKGQSHQMDIFLEVYEINSVLSICALIH